MHVPALQSIPLADRGVMLGTGPLCSSFEITAIGGNLRAGHGGRAFDGHINCAH